MRSADAYSAVEILRRAAVFRPISSNGIRPLAERCTVRTFAPGTALMRQGERSDVMYIIADGRVRVERAEDGAEPVRLAELGVGQVVGEMGVLDRQPRSATVVAISRVEALELGAEPLTEVMVHHPEIAEALRHVVSERLRDTDALVARMFANLLRKVPIFQPVSEDSLERLAERGKRRHFFAGDALMRQGEPSSTIYVIAQGQLRVERSHWAILEPVVLAELGPGEVVGEMGVLDGAPRSATVIADTLVETMELDATAVAGAMAEHPDIASALLHVVTKRMRNTNELLEQLLMGKKGGGATAGG